MRKGWSGQGAKAGGGSSLESEFHGNGVSGRLPREISFVLCTRLQVLEGERQSIDIYIHYIGVYYIFSPCYSQIPRYLKLSHPRPPSWRLYSLRPRPGARQEAEDETVSAWFRLALLSAAEQRRTILASRIPSFLHERQNVRQTRNDGRSCNLLSVQGRRNSAALGIRLPSGKYCPDHVIINLLIDHGMDFKKYQRDFEKSEI